MSIDAEAKKAIQDINEKFGEGSFQRIGDSSKTRRTVENFMTGCLSLDVATNLPGLPRGRIIEFIGLESSGKSTMALRAVAERQRNGELCAYLDAENAFSDKWAKLNGINLDDLVLSQNNKAETALGIVEKACQSCRFGLIVVDSVASLITAREMEGDIGDPHMAEIARLMSSTLKKLVSVAAQSKTTIIFINQLREKVGVMYGNKWTTPGGHALKFYATLRVEFRKKETIKEGDMAIGNEVSIKVVKNKVARPFGEGSFRFLVDSGIDRNEELVGAALERGVVISSGRRILMDDKQLCVGNDNFRKMLADDATLRADVEKRIMDSFNEKEEPKPETPNEGASPKRGKRVTTAA